MKSLIKLTLISGLVLSNSVFALNPVQGMYGGLMGMGSYGPQNSNFTASFNNATAVGDIKHQLLGGGGGGMLGFKFNSFRVEGELLLNINNFDNITFGTCTLNKSGLLTPTGVCPAQVVNDGLGFKGSTTAGYGLINGYYDIFVGGEEAVVIPFVGFGLGMAKVKNIVKFENTRTMEQVEFKNSTTGAAAQMILGVNYFIDDYVWMGLDYRYLTTKKVDDLEGKRYILNTFNFTVDFAFDEG